MWALPSARCWDLPLNGGRCGLDPRVPLVSAGQPACGQDGLDRTLLRLHQRQRWWVPWRGPSPTREGKVRGVFAVDAILAFAAQLNRQWNSGCQDDRQPVGRRCWPTPILTTAPSPWRTRPETSCSQRERTASSWIRRLASSWPGPPAGPQLGADQRICPPPASQAVVARPSLQRAPGSSCWPACMVLGCYFRRMLDGSPP